jgi:hypothetical protein
MGQSRDTFPMADDEFLGIGPLVQFALIGVVGLVVLVAGAVTGGDALLLGVGAVLLGYAVLGGGWSALVEALELSERAQIGVILATAVVLVATNTVAGGVPQLFVGVVLGLYGGGLAISHLTG